MNIPNELIYKDPETIDSLGYSESSVSSEYGTCRSELYSLPSDSQYRIDISQHQKCIDFKSVAGLLSLGSKLEQKIIQKEISRASTLRQESQISVKDEEFKQENLILQERLKNMQTQMNEIRSHFEMEQAKHAKLSDTHEALKVRISGFRQKVKEDLCPKKERDQYHDKAVSLERALEQEKLKLSELRNRSISIENTNKMVFDENTALKKKLIDLENLIDTEYCLITTMKSATQKYDMNLRELKEANCKLSLKIKQIQGQNAEELEHQKVSQQRQILQLSNEKKQLKLDSEKNTETLKIREIELSAIIKTGSNEQKALIDLNLSLETQLQVKSEDLRAASHKIEALEIDLLKSKVMHKQSSEINVKTLEVAQSKLMILESKIGLLKKSLYMLNDLRNESQRHELKRDKHQAMIACLSLENAQNVIDMGNLKRFLTQGIIRIQMEVLDNLKSTMAEIFAKWHSNSAIKSDEIFKLRNLLGRQEMDNLKIKNSLANELHNVKILKKKEANLSDYIFKLQSRIDLIEKQALPKELCINKLSIVSTVASSTCCFSNRLECLKQLKQTILIKNEQARAVPNTARDHKSNFMASISSIWSKNNSKKFTPSPENVFYLRQKFMALLSFLESFYGIHVRNKDVDSRLRVIYSTALVAAEAKPHINP